jgi:NodT family efflux transporter outer membrane factor (OMF) lipoprotein
MKPGRSLLAAALAAAVAACATPGGLEPRAKVAEANGLEAGRSLADARVSASTWPRADWWKGYADPQLDTLVDEALADGPSLRIARARLDKARALALAAGAARAPQVGAGADVSRQRFSENGIFPPPIAGSSFTQYQLALNLGWDLDPWGRNRALYEAALGQARAAEIDAFAARLLVSAGVAHAYVHLARAFDQLDIARQTLAQRETMLKLTQGRVAAGLDSRVELKQVETSIPAARARVLQLEEELVLVRNQLAALLGKGPDRGLALERPRARAQPVALPSSVPADLVGRRPDVVAQRWRVEAARRDVAAAKAQFYPDINLAALVGVQSVELSKLLDSGSAVPSIGGALRLPLFDGGRLRGNLAAKDADYDLAVEQYNQTLVDALREVVDQLASLRSVDAQRTEVLAALGTAEQAYELALARYRAGLGGLLQVLVAETQVLEQRAAGAELRARELDRGIDLVRALGGGFDEERAAPAHDRPVPAAEGAAR